MIHEPDDEPFERPKVRHVMQGAEGPNTPDDKRPLPQVLDDYANSCWGEMRMVCPLDREHATRTMKAHFERLLKVVKGDAEPAKLEAKALRVMLGRVLTAMVRVSKLKGFASDTPKCNDCKRFVTDHAPDCGVRKLVDACSAMGVTVSK